MNMSLEVGSGRKKYSYKRTIKSFKIIEAELAKPCINVGYFPIIQTGLHKLLPQGIGCVYRQINSRYIITDIFGDPPNQGDRCYCAFMARLETIKTQINAIVAHIKKNPQGILMDNVVVEANQNYPHDWNEMPPELWTEVFEYFDEEKRSPVAAVCQYWQAIVGNMRDKQPATYIHLTEDHVINVAAFAKAFNERKIYALYEQAKQYSDRKWDEFSWMRRGLESKSFSKSDWLCKKMNALFALEGVYIEDREEQGIELDTFSCSRN